ncbi:1-acyl-sn-glycerol-3-phosphate acyltransferase [Poriferisphaera corsica]|uniref:1-acyl-sn-glycerol-3-phosphate acyltransferase n=1 Tax=Poriferisphaera corsica TaxID=2528020 RepID=A0A517YTP1_9BACT|nr:lysophospholipid acyltransferase family protein [Poriferisphaera corsica]QDU33587.1 1-acyl-sn-glycerol-3-phosphate acyltransferase [Poriferisphaera corsica]
MSNEKNIESRVKFQWWRKPMWYIGSTLSGWWVRSQNKVTVWNWKNIPLEGATIVVCNHQSYLDPILLGIGSRKRPFWSLARSGLFENKFFGLLIKLLSAIPVEQGDGDIKAMRDCLEVLKHNEALILFPEGARCEDGKIAPFEPGFMLLVKRTKANVIPAAIEGAFDVWPRGQKKPSKGKHIGVNFGQPISNEEICSMKGKQATKFIQEKVEELFQDARVKLGKAPSQDS